MCKNKITAIIIQINNIKWKNVILEKTRKNNHQIWSSYEGEIPHTNFNPRLKEERRTVHVLLWVHEFPWEFFHNRQGNSNFPVCTWISPWVFLQPTKKMWIFLWVRLFSCAFFQNRQENTNFPVCSRKNPQGKWTHIGKRQFPVVRVVSERAILQHSHHNTHTHPTLQYPWKSRVQRCSTPGLAASTPRVLAVRATLGFHPLLFWS